MPVFALDKNLVFPPVDLAEPDGLIAMGGDLSTDRLLLAYRNGIFPWYEGEHILWWSPDPRFILLPGELKVNKTTEKLIKRFDDSNTNEFNSFTINKAFKQVIHACKEIKRPGQEGTWITNEVEHAYYRLHQAGYAHSAELWKDDELMGGLYGIRLGNVFFGESMFSRISNASRITFIKYVRLLKSEGVQLIDCQVHTEYLESLGARMIPRAEFNLLLEKALKQ